MPHSTSEVMEVTSGGVIFVVVVNVLVVSVVVHTVVVVISGVSVVVVDAVVVVVIVVVVLLAVVVAVVLPVEVTVVGATVDGKDIVQMDSQYHSGRSTVLQLNLHSSCSGSPKRFVFLLLKSFKLVG